ncbi:MAG: methyltransferase domain-containing protein [Actinomycetota bacterium]
MSIEAGRPDSLYRQYAGNPAESYEQHFTPAIGVHFARPVVEAADLGKGDLVLDVACGTGIAARLAALEVGPTGSVAGVDVDPAMLEVAATSDGGESIDWRQASAEQLPWDDGSFDAVLCSQGLQFFQDKAVALTEMRRVLTDDGRVALTTPGPTPPLFEAIGDVLAERVGPEASGFVDAVFALHQPAELRELLDAAGFAAIETEYRKVPLRLSPPAHFFWQYVTASPLAAMASQLDDHARAALEHAVVARTQPFTDAEALVTEPGMLLATARPGNA